MSEMKSCLISIVEIFVLQTCTVSGQNGLILFPWLRYMYDEQNGTMHLIVRYSDVDSFFISITAEDYKLFSQFLMVPPGSQNGNKGVDTFER